MKHPISHPFFVVSLLVYGALLLLKKTGHHILLLSDHGADLLAMPVVLSIALFAVRHTDRSRSHFVFHWLHIAFAAALYGFLFEWLFPRLSDRHTADPWDLLAYGLGAILFAIFLNHPPPSKKNGA